MLSKRPYLLQALYDWIVDQGHVPHIVVDASVTGTRVPQQYVQDGQIQLNVSPSAVRNFLMDRTALSFEARFAGSPFQVYVPIRAVMAVFDRDSGSGMAFEHEPDEEFPGEVASATKDDGPKPAPLQVADALDETYDEPVGESADEEDGPDDTPPSGGGKRSGPSLRLVK